MTWSPSFDGCTERASLAPQPVSPTIASANDQPKDGPDYAEAPTPGLLRRVEALALEVALSYHLSERMPRRRSRTGLGPSPRSPRNRHLRRKAARRAQQVVFLAAVLVLGLLALAAVIAIAGLLA